MIICEVGLNHLGDEEYANQYVDTVLGSNADAITFQVLKESFYEDERFKSFKLENEFFIKASQKIKNGNKRFGVAIDDDGAVGFLESLDVSFYKILSKDITNTILLDSLVNNTNKKIFVSTGMSDLSEIDLLFQHIKHIKDRFTFVHTQLTHGIEDVNLKAIYTLRNRFKLPVAFGMHCDNQNVLYLSLAFQPSDMFIYIKGNRSGDHPDEEHAIFLKDIQKVVNNLLELPQSIGEEVKVKMNNWAER